MLPLASEQQELLAGHKSRFRVKTLTCDHSSGEVDVDDAGGEGGQDHTQRGKEASSHHHWATAEAVHQYAAQGSWEKNSNSGV